MNDAIRADSNDETLGMRVYQVTRQRAVERSVDRLRNGLKADWQFLSQDDLANLRWLLGEIWAVKSREEWDLLHFSRLNLAETRQIVGHGDRLRRHRTQRMATIEAVCEIVCAARERGTEPTAHDEVTLAY